MSVVVAMRVQAQSGRAEALAQGLGRLLADSPSMTVVRDAPTLFHGLDDPNRILFVSRWADRETAEVYLRAMGPRPLGRDQASAVEHAFYQQGERLEFMARHPTRFTCDILEFSSEIGPEVATWLQQEAAALFSSLRGFVMRHTFEGLDEASRVCLLYGWTVPGADESSIREAVRRVRAGLGSWAVAVESFVGRTPAEVEVPRPPVG